MSALSVQRWRTDALDPRDSPLGVTARAPLHAGPLLAGDALWLEIASTDPAELAARLPLPVPMVPLFLGPRTESPSALRRLFGRRLFGAPTVSRAVRGAALLLAGYHAVGGGIDRATGLDLTWGVG